MIIVPLEPGHFLNIAVQAAQRGEYALASVEAVMSARYRWAVVNGSETLVCGGVLDIPPHRGICWAFLSEAAGPRMQRITGMVRRCITLLPHERLELSVDVDFEAGHRWAKLLGFELETERMRKYGLDKRDHAMYVRIK